MKKTTIMFLLSVIIFTVVIFTAADAPIRLFAENGLLGTTFLYVMACLVRLAEMSKEK